eukprot:TCALIF_07354-PA protein Name:"Protein of unknown function" AED:0.17 eAED:0.17 QI:0/0.75/0.8/1/0.75/0.8/5/166/792
MILTSKGQANTKGTAKEASGMSSSSSPSSSLGEMPNTLRSPKDQRKTQEYLLLNYPRDVRRNLKDLVLPEDVKNPPGNPKKADPNAENWAEDEEEEDEWEWEEDEDVPEEEEGQTPNCNGHENENEDDDGDEDEDDSKGVKGVPEIKIKGNILRIDRKDVVWSDDEYEADSPPDTPVETNAPVIGNGQPKSIPPPPPMPNGIPVAPPPPPGKPKPSPVNNEKVEQLKKRAKTTPVWTDLMEEISGFRTGHGKLRKVVCNDRSRPILSTEKVGENFLYESEMGLPNQDILKDIRKGVKLKRVRTNDRSRPCLRGIRNFRRQTTKEERLKNGFAFEEDEPLGLEGVEDDENPEELRDDLESTKQLLELEVRSKKLLEKDNKRLQIELERLKAEFQKMSSHKQEGHEDNPETQAKINSVANKRRQSIVRLLSESDVPSMLAAAAAAEEDKPPAKEKTITEEDECPEPVGQRQFDVLPPFVRTEIPAFEDEVIETMKEEVDEARKLAEEWEMKYKEMQRQMAEMDNGRRGGADLDMGRRTSVSGAADPSSAYQRMSSTNSNFNDQGPAEDEDEETWMQRREYHQLEQKLRTIADKREIVARERKLLTERMETITVNIGQEMEARKKLKKDLLEMNEAFKEEIMEMESEEKTKAELEECYYSDEESLVPATTRRTNSTESEEESYEEYDEDVAETLDDILKLAEDEEEEDPGHTFFDHYPESEDEEDTPEEAKPDWEAKLEKMNGKIDRHGDNLQTMRKSNFLLKSKIDRMYDILQMQREKHHDLKQELTRMLSDIQ